MPDRIRREWCRRAGVIELAGPDKAKPAALERCDLLNMAESGESARVLGIDPGMKRFGLAISDPLGVTAQGLDTFTAGEGVEFVDHLRELIDRYGVKIVVLGLPLSMGGGEIEGTEKSRELQDRIRKEFGVEVVLRDERMTSLEAERVLKREGRIRDAGDIDRLAAVLLLQDYLDERE